jgi:hypothetical protein
MLLATAHLEQSPLMVINDGGSLPVDVLEEFEKKKKKTLVADGTYKVGFFLNNKK